MGTRYADDNPTTALANEGAKLGDGTKMATQQQPLVDPYQTAIGTPQIIACLNSIDGNLDRINNKLDDKLTQVIERLDKIISLLGSPVFGNAGERRL